MYPEFAPQSDSTRTTHPGTVTFVGPDGTERVELADQIPEWLKFAPGADGTAIPVVRVVRLAGERGYSLRSYGVNGQLLWVGMTVPAATPSQIENKQERPTSRPSATVRMPAARPEPRPLAEPTGWF